MPNHVKLFGWYIYASRKILRERSGREKPITEERRMIWRDKVLTPLRKRSNWRCELCGKKRKLVVHHILPYGDYPEYELNLDNLLYVCNDCHNEIHNNPWLSAPLMREAGKTFGIDVEKVYKQKILLK